MSGTKFDYRNTIYKLITKIDTILSQLVKTKRIANQNNIILKYISKLSECMLDTIPLPIEVISRENMDMQYDCEDLRTQDEFCL
jgi:hypothetical protein